MGEARASGNVDSQLCFALYSTLHAVGRAYAGVLPELDLTYPQYLVMLVLWEEDGIGVKQIGDRLFLDSGTITPLLKRLDAAGLVKRVRDPRDERQVQVTLTEQGRALRTKASGVPERIGCAMGQSPEDLARLRDDLLRLRASLLRNRPG